MSLGTTEKSKVIEQFQTSEGDTGRPVSKSPS